MNMLLNDLKNYSWIIWKNLLEDYMHKSFPILSLYREGRKNNNEVS